VRSDPLAPVPLSVYTPTPEQARAAALYVCTVMPKEAAVEVLQMLGLVPTRSVLGRAGWRDPAARGASS